MPHWQTATASPKLQADELHVWKITLDRDDTQWQPHMALLSADEQAKADRYRFEKHRRRYISGRTALRILLGGYLGRAPETLSFNYNDHGKPSLAQNNSKLRFNVSHTEGIMLAGFVLNSEIGIDIETIQHDIDYMGIGQRWFSKLEHNTLLTLPEQERIDAFFRAWSRKEAFIKALGTGLSYPLNGFSVRMDNTGPTLIRDDDKSQGTTHWKIHDIEISSAYSAAVAIKNSEVKIRYYHLALKDGDTTI
jgi:4'-phosphopantetheinyl transferase